MRVLERLVHPFEDCLRLSENLVIPETTDSIALLPEKLRPTPVRLHLRGVLPAIDLDHQPGLRAAAFAVKGPIRCWRRNLTQRPQSTGAVNRHSHPLILTLSPGRGEGSVGRQRPRSATSLASASSQAFSGVLRAFSMVSISSPMIFSVRCQSKK